MSNNLIGQRFGRLTVIAPAAPAISANGNVTKRWLCKCDCGNTKAVREPNLISGGTKSCGCYTAKLIELANKGNNNTRHYVAHGGTHSRLWGVHKSMMSRCYNPNNSEYSSYGARGITVCEEWYGNFSAFKKWAEENGYDENAPKGKCTLDRIDNDEGYSPDNCRWVDLKTQCRNQRKTLYLTIDGVTKPLMEWSEQEGAPRAAVMRWRKHQGWSDEEVLYGKRR